MDESVIVLEGSFTFTCGDRDIEASAGDFARLPRGVEHRHAAGPAGGRMLILGTPGGLERFFDDWEAGMSVEAIAHASDIEFLDAQMLICDQRSSPLPNATSTTATGGAHELAGSPGYRAFSTKSPSAGAVVRRVR